MSAETLRRAAALMRERAEGTYLATDSGDLADWHTPADLVGMFEEEGDGDYIASWHPAVALAVADWLDAAGADLWAHGPLCECGSGCHACDDDAWQPHVRRALAVARAYLGEAS